MYLEVRGKLTGVKFCFFHVGPRNRIQVVRLGGTFFTRWAISPGPWYSEFCRCDILMSEFMLEMRKQSVLRRIMFLCEQPMSWPPESRTMLHLMAKGRCFGGNWCSYSVELGETSLAFYAGPCTTTWILLYLNLICPSFDKLVMTDTWSPNGHTVLEGVDLLGPGDQLACIGHQGSVWKDIRFQSGFLLAHWCLVRSH